MTFLFSLFSFLFALCFLPLPLPPNIHLPAGAVGLGALLGLELGNCPEHVAEFFKAVVAGVKVRRAVVDLVAHAAEVGPAGFLGHVVHGFT